jgi:hypothetical protein
MYLSRSCDCYHHDSNLFLQPLFHHFNRPKDLFPADPSRVKCRKLEIYGILQQFLLSSLEVHILIDQKGEEIVIEGDLFSHLSLFSPQHHPHILP